MAETTNPNGGASSWEDKGFVVCSSSDKGKDGYSRASTSDWDAYFYFNAIDPSYFIDDDGSHWLVYGSWHSGFALVRINPETGKIAAVSSDDYLTGTVLGDFDMGFPWAETATILKQNGYGTRIFSRGTSRWQPSEAPELIKYNGYYWLFFANDGLDVPYQTRVVRSEKIQGPYKSISGVVTTNDVENNSGGTNLFPIVTHPYKFDDSDNGLGSCYGWVGISHCAVFSDDEGNWYYMSQQRLPADIAGINASNAVMLGAVRKIVWTPSTAQGSDLWPMVLPERYAEIPESYAEKITKDELIGEWQHINLVYNYAVMDEALPLILHKDGTMEGALNGTWDFDSDSLLMTFRPNSATAVSVKVCRELNWEAKPRVPTIVYTGTQKNLSATYWGKQVANIVE